MNFKKILIIITLFVFSLTLINSLIILKDTDEVDKEYIYETYGKGMKEPDFSAEQMLEGEFDFFKRYAMEDAAYSKDLSEAQQQELMSKLKAMKFKNRKMVFFKMVLAEPALPNDVKFTVKLLNAKGESLSIFDYYQSFKYTYRGYFGVTTTTYQYYWIIEADRQLKITSFEKDELPVKMIVEFPNGQKRTFLAKM